MLKLEKFLIFAALMFVGAMVSQAYAADNAAFVSQSAPTTMLANQTYAVSVTMKNTGTTTWTKARNYKLGSQNPQDNKTWGTARVLLSDTDAILPGQSKTFTFTVKAPSSGGTRNFQWRMLREGVAWFGSRSTNLAIPVTALPDNAQFISQSVPSQMSAGLSYPVSVTMKNLGTNPWTATASYKLNSQNPLNNAVWGMSKVLLSSTDSIGYGQTKTFNFTVKAPAAAGTYNFQWRMMKDGTTPKRFGEYSQNMAVLVKANNAPVLSNIGNKTVNEGQLLTFTVSATDPDGNPLTYSASSLPQGASFNPATGTFSWTPSFTQAGTYSNVRFTVSDGKLTDYELIAITVNNAPSEAEQFVIASGNRLVLKQSGKNFYFSSTNQYYLFYKPVAMVDEVFNDAKAMGLNVIRTWGFCDGWKDGVSFQSSPGVYEASGFSRMDYLIKKARDLGMRLIIPLVNNWSDFGGMFAYVNWSPTAPKTHDAFYTDPNCRYYYKNYVNYFLNRTNSLTGIKYKDDPTILIWELANEPRCQSDPTGNTLNAWIEEMSAFIKSIDPNHLVSTGQEGFYKKVSGDWRYNGYTGQDYIRNNQLPNIDVCSLHLLFNDFVYDEALASKWITEHANDAHFTINKPVYCGEIAYRVVRQNPDAAVQMANRNRLYTDWYNKFTERLIDGAGFWLLSADTYADYDGYTVYYPGDTLTCSIISDFSARMNELRSLNYMPPIIKLEDKEVNETTPLEFQIPLSNPGNLALTFSSPNLPIGATINNNGYFSWLSPAAGFYKDIEVVVSYNSSVVANGKFNINVIDVNGDNTPKIASIPPITMTVGSTLDNAVDLWAYTTDDDTPVQDLVFSFSTDSPANGVTLDGNRYIDIVNPTDSTSSHWINITATDSKGLKGYRWISLSVNNAKTIGSFKIKSK